MAADNPCCYKSPFALQNAQPPIKGDGYAVALGWYRAGCFRRHIHEKGQLIVTGPKAAFETRWRIGRGRWHCRHLNDEQVLLIPGGTEVQIDWRRPAPLIAIELDDDFVSAFSGGKPLSRFSVSRLGAYIDPEIQIGSVALRCWRECQREGPQNQQVVARLAAWFATLLLETHFQPTLPGDPKKWRLHRKRLADVLSHIEEIAITVSARERLVKNESTLLKRLARVAGFKNESYFGQLFRSATGISPLTYVMGARVRKAQELVRSGMRSMTEVAHRAGFSHSAHMTACFKRVVGAVPSSYRPHVKKNSGENEMQRKPVRWRFS